MRSTDSLVKIGKWSDGEQWVTDRDGASGIPAAGMKISRRNAITGTNPYC